MNTLTQRFCVTSPPGGEAGGLGKICVPPKPVPFRRAAINKMWMNFFWQRNEGKRILARHSLAPILLPIFPAFFFAAWLCFSTAFPARAHVHVQMSYAAGQWHLFLYDFEGGQYEANEAPLYVGHPTFGFVTADISTNFLGRAGDGLWTLPETENPNLLYLGLGTQGIAPGTFVNNQIRLELRSVSGPGHFALYNVDPFGTPVVHMNSRDGINPTADSIALASLGGHVHVNWAFSAPGTYHVGLGARGVLAGGSTNASPTVDYTFIVQDIPWRPRLRMTRGAGGTNALLTLETKVGAHCRLECTTNFTSWAVLTNFTTTSTSTVLAPPPALQHCACRAIVLPP